MAITYEELELLDIFRDLGKICKTENVCGSCVGSQCLIGYGKECASRCRMKGVTYVKDGVKDMPKENTQSSYDSDEVLHMIGHLLVQCRACQTNHYDNCIISVLRNCLEKIEFGQRLDYKGTPLEYLMMLNDFDQEKARIVLAEYRKGKEATSSNENSGQTGDASRDEADSGGGACKRQRVS
jgi:hypothetical protein